jgi:hypothetical protein
MIYNILVERILQIGYLKASCSSDSIALDYCELRVQIRSKYAMLCDCKTYI